MATKTSGEIEKEFIDNLKELNRQNSGRMDEAGRRFRHQQAQRHHQVAEKRSTALVI